MSSLLKHILQSAESSKNSLYVFDLDSTLFCVSGRTQKILQTTPNHLKDIPSKQAELLKNIKVNIKDFNLHDILKRAGVQLSFPCYKQIFHFWTNHFFSNDFLKYDTLYKGVSSYLQKLQNTHSEIMYLTGRCYSLMGKGTYQQLEKWNLPLKTKNHLMMKENAYTEDAYYKKCRLQKLSQKYQNIWFFENEPAVIHFAHHFLPKISYVFINSANSGRQTLQKGFHQIPTDYTT